MVTTRISGTFRESSVAGTFELFSFLQSVQIPQSAGCRDEVCFAVLIYGFHWYFLFFIDVVMGDYLGEFQRGVCAFLVQHFFQWRVGDAPFLVQW